MSGYEDAVPPHHLKQYIEEAHDFFAAADQRERNADERSKRIAEAHTRGWEQVARAINDGFRLVAKAISDRR